MNHCPNHPNEISRYHCTKCQQSFCEACVTIRPITEQFTAYICKACGGKCEPLKSRQDKRKLFFALKPFKKPNILLQAKPQGPTPQKTKESTRHFWVAPLSVLVFPFKRWGLLIMAVFALLFWGLDWILKNFYSIGLLSLTVLVTYFLVFLFRVADDTTQGVGTLKGWVGLDYWLSVVQPAVYVGIAILLCFGPSSIYFLNTQRLDWIFFGLLGAGIFLLPMFLVRIVILKDPYGLHPVIALDSIRKTFLAYVLTCLWIGGLMALQFYVNTEYLGNWGWWGSLLSQWLRVYLWVVYLRLLGVLGRMYRDKLVTKE